MFVEKKRGISLEAKLAVGAMLAAALLILAYQRVFRADKTQAELRDPRPAIIPVETGDKLEVSAQKRGVSRMDPVILRKSAEPPPKPSLKR